MKKTYLFILFVWLFGLFLRLHRQSVLLGFYYDQGRDAQIAADIISLKNLPAIGPTTGIQGLHLGPFWFYLITPGYFLGQGSPVVAAGFIAFIESLTIPLIFITLNRFWNIQSALFTATLWSFSYYLIRSARWFSNPSPIPFFVISIIYLTSQVIINKKYKYLPLVSLLLGLSLQLEAASAIFFFPSLLLIFLFSSQLSKIKIKYYLNSVLVFFLLLIPQFLFDLKNNFLISKNFLLFLSGKLNTTGNPSWSIPSLSFITNRFGEYYKIFFTKLDTNLTFTSLFFLLLFIALLLISKKFFTNKFFQIILIWLFLPLFLLLFFSGNYGRLYDYYLTGFFPAFFILFGILITSIPIIPLVVLLLFFRGNLIFIKNYLSANPDGPQHISLGNQLQALDYICHQNIDYSLDIYVPPITPYSYQYLLSWLNRHQRCRLPLDYSQTQTHFILYEVDPNSPQNLSRWLQSQKPKPDFRQVFGGIVVETKP